MTRESLLRRLGRLEALAGIGETDTLEVWADPDFFGPNLRNPYHGQAPRLVYCRVGGRVVIDERPGRIPASPS